MATTKEEIAEIIEKSVVAHAADLSPDHLEYRRICAEIDEFEEPYFRCDDAGDAALAHLLEKVGAIAERVWAKPAGTLGDVLLRGEIAFRNMEASFDERASDELIRAVVDVLGVNASATRTDFCKRQ